MPQTFGKANRAKPTATAESGQVQTRVGRYAETFTNPLGRPLVSLADEGSYFKAINPTPDTGISMSVNAGFLTTNAAFMIFNGSGGSTRLYMDYIRLIVKTVPASAVRSEVVLAIDDTSRYSSGGSTLTAVNTNMDDTTASIATVRFGALTLAAEGANVRRIVRAKMFQAILVAESEFLFTFGAEEGYNAPQTITGTTALKVGIPLGPAIIGPGDNLMMHMWHPSNSVTGAAFEVEVGWWER